MEKIVIKRRVEGKSKWELLVSAFYRVFKRRTFMVNSNGNLIYYTFSPALQFFITLFVLGLCGWCVFTTHVYINNSDMIVEKNAQVAEARNKFNTVVADIKAYKDMIAEINKKLEKSHNNIVNLLAKGDKISKEEKDNLIKNRVLLSSELNYVNKNFNEFAKDIKWSNINMKNFSYVDTKNELEKNIAINENLYLKKKNASLEHALSDMKELQDNLINKVSVLADDGIKNVENTLSKIDIVLSDVNLKDRKALVKAVLNEKNVEGVGGKYIPLKNITLLDADLNQKYQDLNEKVNLWDGITKAKMMLPLGAPVKDMRITSPFGVRSDPFFKTPAMHSGIDFGGKEGTPLYATSAGRVIQAGPRGDYGDTVEVDHGLGFSTLYAHLSKINVEKGDIIDEGTKVGLAGSTGRSTGPHLHYEVRYNSRPINPYAFVKVENKDK